MPSPPDASPARLELDALGAMRRPADPPEPDAEADGPATDDAPTDPSPDSPPAP